MTNEELVQQYYQGSKDALEQLYLKNKKLIRKIAIRSAEAFNYSEIEELCSVGVEAFLDLLSKREYDPEKGKLSTYLYPQLQGTMFRFLEQNTGSIPLSKHQMELIRKAQRLYHELNMAVDAVAAKMNISSTRAVQLINHNTHTISFDELYDEEQDCPFTESVEHAVLRNIQLTLMEEEFHKLSAKDQYILGSCVGVFGYEQKSVEDLAFEEMLTPDGVYKAKEAALQRLRKLCRNSAIPLWHQAHILTQKIAWGR